MSVLSPVYLDGRLLPVSSARVSVRDQGLLLGLGVFETLRTYGGRPFRLRAHLSRLAATAAWLGIALPESSESLADATLAVIDAVGGGGLRVRITVTAGCGGDAAGLSGCGVAQDDSRRKAPATSVPTRLITAQPLGPERDVRERGVAALRLRCPRGVGPLAGKKVTSFAFYVWARRWAATQGAGEALLLDPEGRVVEGAFSNVFVVAGGRVMTPALSAGALPGITRQAVLELLSRLGLEGGETDLQSEELREADEIFLTSSVAEVTPVVALDGVSVGDGRVGPVTRRIAEAYRALALRETRGA